MPELVPVNGPLRGSLKLADVPAAVRTIVLAGANGPSGTSQDHDAFLSENLPKLSPEDRAILGREVVLRMKRLDQEVVNTDGCPLPGAKHDLADWKTEHSYLRKIAQELQVESQLPGRNVVELLRNEVRNAVRTGDAAVIRLIRVHLDAELLEFCSAAGYEQSRELALYYWNFPLQDPIAAEQFLAALELERDTPGAGVRALREANIGMDRVAKVTTTSVRQVKCDVSDQNETWSELFHRLLHTNCFRFPNPFKGQFSFLKPKHECTPL